MLLNSFTHFNSPTQKPGSKDQKVRTEAAACTLNQIRRPWTSQLLKRHENAGVDPTLPVAPGGRGT